MLITDSRSRHSTDMIYAPTVFEDVGFSVVWVVTTGLVSLQRWSNGIAACVHSRAAEYTSQRFL